MCNKGWGDGLGEGAFFVMVGGVAACGDSVRDLREGVCVVCFVRVCMCVLLGTCVPLNIKEQKRQLRVGPCVVSRPGAHLGTARSCRYGAELAQKRYVLPTV